MDIYIITENKQNLSKHNHMPAQDIIPAKKSLHALHPDAIHLCWPVDPSTPPFFRREMHCTCVIYSKVCVKNAASVLATCNAFVQAIE
jgi:hypothetical protein